MKVTNILSKTLCIYDGQVLAHTQGGEGSKGGRVEEKDRGEGGIKEEARRNINKLAYL